jgi:hypothetical protein
MIAVMARYTETVYPVKKLVPLTSQMAEAISEYRHQQRISSENEAIRQLIAAGLSKASTATPSGGGEPGESDKPAGSVAPAPKKPAAPERKAEPAAPRSKLDQIRAMREQGAR